MRENLTGNRYGRLIVVNVIDSDCKKGSGRLCECICDCGNKTKKREYSLKYGITRSCGCLSAELSSQRATERVRKNNWGNTDLRRKWREMKLRCSDRHRDNYKNYGARGISVCADWDNDYYKFEEWAINNGYKIGKSLDRIDVNGNYEPSNCRWIDLRYQARNKRNTIYLTAFGETKCLSDWIEEYGIKRSTVTERIKRGWEPWRAISTPPHRNIRWEKQ